MTTALKSNRQPAKDLSRLIAIAAIAIWFISQRSEPLEQDAESTETS